MRYSFRDAIEQGLGEDGLKNHSNRFCRGENGTGLPQARLGHAAAATFPEPETDATIVACPDAPGYNQPTVRP
jgi:hypothetical protein